MLPGCDYWIPENDIIQDLRNGFSDGKIKFELNGELFQDLLDFATSGLTVFYQVFMKSEKFAELKEEVRRQEVLYYVLHKY